MKATERDYTEMEAALKPLGFERVNNGFFYHELTEKLFDFSACSIEGCMSKIYYDGRIDGKQALKETIKTFVTENIFA